MVSMVSNMAKLAAELPSYVTGAIKLYEQHKEIIEKADEYGKKAIAAGIRTFHEILDLLHPGVKVTNQEANTLV